MTLLVRTTTTGGSVVVILTLCLTQVGCHRNAQYYLDTGTRYYAEGKYADASINYRKSIQIDPNLAESHYRLGLAESMQRHDRAAYEEFRRGIELAPGRDDIRVQLAEVALNGYLTSRDKPSVLYDQVLGAANYLLGKDPNSFDGLRLRADLLSIDRRFEDAIAMYKKANTIRPSEPSVVYPMIQVLFQLNQISEGEDLGKRFLQVHKDVGTVYDALIAQYMRDKRTADAEQLLKSKVVNMPRDAGAILELASFYQQLQRAPEMSQTLNKILSDPKNFPQGHATVGDFFVSIRKTDEALREYQLGLQSGTKQKANYQKRIARVLATQGKRDQAVEQLSEVLKENPDDADSRLARAMLLRESSDPKNLDWAVSELNSLIQRAPNDEIAHYNLGLAFWAKGDSNSARGQLMESARLRPDYIPPRKTLAEIDQKERNYSETIRIADEILAVNPDDADARLLHAAGLLGNKAYQPARAELGTLLRKYPNSVIINLYMAVLDVQEQKYREAEARYHQLYKPGDKDLRPLEGLIQLYIAERQPDKAIALLDQELKHNPDSRPVHLLFASTATNAGKLDLAMQQYQWLQVNSANSPVVYESLGDFYQLKGDVNSALASYQKAREMVPNDPKIIAMIAFLQNASGKEVEAISNLQKQLAIDPQDTIAMNNLAFLLADTSTDLDRALVLVQTAQRKVPNNPGIEDTLAWVYVKKGLNDSAIQILNGLVKKYPDEPAFRYHLGVALLQKGQPAEAKAEFVISLSSHPPKDMAEKIKHILDLN